MLTVCLPAVYRYAAVLAQYRKPQDAWRVVRAHSLLHAALEDSAMKQRRRRISNSNTKLALRRDIVRLLTHAELQQPQGGTYGFITPGLPECINPVYSA